MDKIEINGGKKLTGEVKVSGAKRSITSINSITISIKRREQIKNVPALSDVETINNVISTLNAEGLL